MTPAPTVSVPLVTRMPSPLVFWMATLEMLEVNVAVPGCTRTAMPAAKLLPSSTSGAAGSPEIAEALLFRRVPAAVPCAVVASVTVIGPPVVVSVVLVGIVIGKGLPAARPRGVLPDPTSTILVPAGGDAPSTATARVMVLNAHPGADIAPEVLLPVPVASLPFTGST